MYSTNAVILRSPGIAASAISLLSMGGVCGRSLTTGKIDTAVNFHYLITYIILLLEWKFTKNYCSQTLMNVFR